MTPPLPGLIPLGTARVLAAAIQNVGDVQVALFGKQAIDGDSGHTPVQVARKLGWTPLTYVSAITELGDGKITVERLTDDGKKTVTTNLPVVISVVKEINEPRYPSFMGIRKASKATIPQWTAGDLTIDGAPVHQPARPTGPMYTPSHPRGAAWRSSQPDSVQEQARILVEQVV
ncbi:MAG: hypothetical protein R3C44_18260 [Chloroflexota bacterium]